MATGNSKKLIDSKVGVDSPTMESTLVQMRLQPITLARVNSLSKMFNTDNRTQVVSASVQIAENLVSQVKAGAKIYVEKPDGTKELLQFIGI